MKIYKNKEEKKKIGRPKLADTKLKKNGIVIGLICILVIISLIISYLFELNIINLNKLKGNASLYCNEMSDELKESFDDLELYSLVIKSIPNNTQTMCSTATKSDLETITSLTFQDTNIESFKGIDLLQNVESISINSYNKLIDIHDLPKLTTINSSYTPDVDYLKIKNVVNLDYSESFFDISKYKNIEIINAPKLVVRTDNHIDEKIESIYIDNIKEFRYSQYMPYIAFDELKSITLKNIKLMESFSFYDDDFPKLNKIHIENSSSDGITIDYDKVKDVYINNIEVSGIALINYNKDNFDGINFVKDNEGYAELLLLKYKKDTINIPNYDYLAVTIVGSNIKKLDLLNNNNVYLLISDNDFENKTLYVQKGERLNFEKIIKLNPNVKVTYESSDESIISNSLVAKKVGTAQMKYSVDRNYYHCDFDYDYGFNEPDEYLLNNKVVVYDIDSSKYEVNTTTKEIDVNNLSLDLNKIDITAEELRKEVVGDKLYIKDGDDIVDTYTLKNIKKDSVVVEDNRPVVTTTTKRKTITNIKNIFNTTDSDENDIPEEKYELVTPNETKKVEKIIYRNNSNNIILYVMNGIEGILIIVLLVLLIKNSKRS